MKIPYITIAAVLAGAALGAMGSQALKAQVPPIALVVGEIDVENAPAYFKEYVPAAAKAIVDGGGKYVVRNGKSVSLYGEPPKALAIMQIDTSSPSIRARPTSCPASKSAPTSTTGCCATRPRT